MNAEGAPGGAPKGGTMKIITTLGVIAAFAAGGAGCDGSSARHGGESTAGDEREHERKGKTESGESWKGEDEAEELRDETKEKADEAGDWTEDKAEDAKDFSKEKARDVEEGYEKSKDDVRDALDDETQREYDIVD